MDTVEIIHLTPDQWQQFKQIRLEALKNEPQAYSSTYEESSQRPDSHWQGRLADAAEGKTNWLLFAQRDSRLIGIIGAYISDEPDTADIISVYVTQAERGKGVAKALMTGILREISRNDSVRKVRLGVNKVQHPAMALYRSFGFEVVGEVNALLGDGQPAVEYIMERPLADPTPKEKE